MSVNEYFDWMQSKPLLSYSSNYAVPLLYSITCLLNLLLMLRSHNQLYCDTITKAAIEPLTGTTWLYLRLSLTSPSRCLYSQTKRALPSDVTSGQWGDLATFCCGLVSGLGASVVTQPADVIKTRVQLTALATGGPGSLGHAIGLIYQVRRGDRWDTPQG